MKFYIAEFQKPFLDLLSATADASPLELFSNPNIYLHDIRYPDTCPVAWRTAKTLQAKVEDMNFAYHDKLETTQIVMFLNVEGQPKGFQVYASLVNDAYANKASRRYSRSLQTAIVEMRLTLTINVIEVDSHSTDGKLLVDTFSALNKDSLTY